MDEMTAFDRQIARDVLHEAGPPGPVDGAAILTAITTTQSPKWRFQSMFSATKFVVAGAIVALFGGFLLAGVLTTQPSEESAPAAATGGPGTFSPAGSLSEARQYHTATLLTDGRVLVVGGESDNGLAVDSAEVWDPATATFEPAGQLPEGRRWHTATRLRDGRVLIVGGMDGPGYDSHAKALLWDPATESFEPAGTLTTPRFFHVAVLLSDGRVLVAGGSDSDDGDEYRGLASAEVWDPATETFVPTGSLAARRGNWHTATLLHDGRVLVAGGLTLERVPSPEIWDPATDTFGPPGSASGRWGHAATPLSDGRVLVVGGKNSGHTTLRTADVWDPATGSFEPTGSLSMGRDGPSATLLPDGRVLVIGGIGTISRGSTEIWDPASESFSPAGSLAHRGAYHTATGLQDGRVLVVGDGAAEVWEPGRTSQPRPDTDSTDDTDATTPNILPGVDLVTEEVEPGVYRVLNDSAGHDLDAEPPTELMLAPDGDLVLFYPSGEEARLVGYLERFYTLGESGEWAIGGLGADAYWFDAAFDNDGNLIAPLSGEAGARLASFDGDAWTELNWPNGSAKVSAVETGPDGAVWVTRDSTGPWPRVARIEDGELTVLPMLDDGTSGRYEFVGSSFAIAPDGTIWHATADSGCGLPRDTKRLVYFDGEAWHEPDLPTDLNVSQATPGCEGLGDDLTHYSAGPLAIGPDGTLWVYVAERASTDAPRALLRLSDGEWTVFTEADGVPNLIGAQTFGARLVVDGEGTLWIWYNGDHDNATLPPSLGSSDGPHGVLSFDGSTWRQYLKGHRVNRVEVAEDASVWATSLGDCTDVAKKRCWEAGGGGLYVITPEAVARTEEAARGVAERMAGLDDPV